MSDGGNVELVEIDGLTVKLKLMVSVIFWREYSVRLLPSNSVNRELAVPVPLLSLQ